MLRAKPAAASEKERREFDNLTGDSIASCEDCSTLNKAAAYFREQGCHPTAEAIYARLNELGAGRAVSPPAADKDTAEARSSILSFQAEAKQHSRLARQPGIQADLQPPVRGAFDAKRAILSTAKEGSGPAGTAAAAMRQSLDLSDQKDQQLLGPGGLKVPCNGTAPKPAAGRAGAAAVAAAAAATAGLGLQQQQQQESKPIIEEVHLTGAKRTRQLAEQNMQLPEADKHAMALSKRYSGNGHFKAGAYAEAVEEYTLSISLDPTAVPTYTNRAAAYMKLKEWQAVIADCDRAVELLKDEPGSDKLMDLWVKTWLRRAEARAALGNHQEALRDWEEALVLCPDEPKAKQGMEAAKKALAGSSSSSSNVDKQGVQRMAVEEGQCSDEEEEAAAAAPPSPAAAAPLPPAAAAQTKGVGEPAQSWQEVQQQQRQQGMQEQRSKPQQDVTSESISSAVRVSQPAAAEAAADAPQQPASQPAATSSNSSSSDTGALAAGFDAADMAVRMAAVAEADAAATFYGSSSSSSSESEDGAESDDELVAAAGFFMEDDVPDPMAEAVVEVPPTYEQQLNQLREAGNVKYRAGEHAEAINLYDKALSHAPGDARLYNNRAIAKLCLDKYDSAHQDASMAISLDPNNSKAYHRRYKAKLGLKDYMGAVCDLQDCIQRAASKARKPLQEELEALQEQMDAELAAAETAAQAARAASSITYSSCTIEEVVDEPMEAMQRLHDDLRMREQTYGRVAARMRDTAVQLREEWEHTRQHQQAREQHRLQQLEQQRQRQQQHREKLAAAQAQAAAKRAAKEERRKEKAAAAAAAAQAAACGGSSSGSAAVHIFNRRAGHTGAAAAARVRAGTPAAAEPLTPPASPYDGKLIHTAAAKAAHEASAAKAAARGEAASANSSTPAASPAPAPTPAATPAGSYKAASMLQQQQARSTPTAAEVQQSVERRVEALKLQGNARLKAGQLQEAEAAYREALQLDGDNAKVLLNVAQLRLAQRDGAGAVRAAEEVLALQGLDEEARRKATLRRGLGLELQGDYEAALWHVSQLYKEHQQRGQPVPEQLSRDMERIATALQQQRHPGLAGAERDADSTAAGSRQPHTDQQQQQHAATAVPAAAGAAAVASAAAVLAFTGMRVSIPVMFSSDSEDETETEQADASEHQASTPSSTGLAAAAGCIGAVEQQQEGHAAAAAAAGSSEQPFTARSAFNITKKRQIPTVCETSSKDEDEYKAAQQHSPSAAAAGLTEPPSEACQQAAAAYAAASESPAGVNEQLAAKPTAHGNAVGQQQQQQEGRGLHQRSYSAGASDSAGPAEDTAGQAFRRLMEATDMSKAQQKAGSSSSSSSSSSSDDSPEAWDPELFKAQIGERKQHGQSQQQQLEQLKHLKQQLVRQEQLKQLEELRQQQQEQLRQRWWLQLLQEHPQARAELDKVRQVQTKLMVELLNDLAKSSGSGSGGASSSSNDSKFAEQVFQRDNRAAAARDAGDRALKQGNAQAALKHCNTAVAALPADPRGYAGRAQVWLRLRRPQHAEEDCGLALLLATAPKQEALSLMALPQKRDEQNEVDVALLGRVRRTRATAWKELGKLKEALGEVKQLLAESPSDVSLQRLLAELKQAYAKQVKQAVQAAQQKGKPLQEQQEEAGQQEEDAAAGREASTNSSAAPAAATVAEVSEPVSQVQRHRIVIEETDGSESEDDNEEESSFRPAAPVQQQHAPQCETDSNAPRVAAAVPAAPAPGAAEQQPAGSNAAPPAARPAAAAPAAAAVERRVHKQLAHKQLSPPRTAVEFINTVKLLLSAANGASGSDALGQYVRLLDPARYKAVFKQELSEGLVRWLVQGLQALVGQEPEFVAQALLQLSRVERFTVVLSMAAANKGTKATLLDLLERLAAAGQEMAPLRAAYKMR